MQQPTSKVLRYDTCYTRHHTVVPATKHKHTCLYSWYTAAAAADDDNDDDDDYEWMKNLYSVLKSLQMYA